MEVIKTQHEICASSLKVFEDSISVDIDDHKDDNLRPDIICKRLIRIFKRIAKT